MSILLLLSALAAEPTAPPTTGPRGPEPVYDLAKRDLAHLKTARFAQLLALSTPAVFLAGAFASRELPIDEQGKVTVSLQATGATTLTTLGLGTMMASSILLHNQAIRSRKRLVAQGLSVPRTPSVVVPTLTILGAFVASAANTTGPRTSQIRSQGLVLGLGMYAVAVGIGTYQLDLNRRARKEAGWIGLAPMLDDRTSGVALAGRW
ncbi:MAG: hypothetical protein R3F61_12825 [Myxococcota bacterium]